MTSGNTHQRSVTEITVRMIATDATRRLMTMTEEMYRPEIVAQRVRTARESMHLSQMKLADLVPCGNKTLSLIECQKLALSVPMAIALAKILRVSPSWLLDLENTYDS